MNMSFREHVIGMRPQAKAYAGLLRDMPPLSGSKAKVAGLNVYPIKALEGLRVESAQISPQGLRTADGAYGDRSAMFAIPGKGETLARFSQRDEPALAQIRAYCSPKGLRYEGWKMPALVISPEELLPRLEQECSVDCAGDTLPAAYEHGQVTEWIRSFLKKNVANPRYDPESVSLLLPVTGQKRIVARQHSNCMSEIETGFSDGGQLLVTSVSTLKWMNSFIHRMGSDVRRLEMDAFRPNIVLEGLPPNAEDVISLMMYEGDAVLHMASPCVRCIVTMLDPKSGIRRTDGQPLKWLSEERPPREDKKASATFGVNAAFESQATGKTLDVGSSFVVTEEKSL